MLHISVIQKEVRLAGFSHTEKFLYLVALPLALSLRVWLPRMVPANAIGRKDLDLEHQTINSQLEFGCIEMSF